MFLFSAVGVIMVVGYFVVFFGRRLRGEGNR